MNEQILEKENMNSIKALSDVNIKISDAKNLLFKLQEEETEYLVKREEKALEKINKVLNESKDLLDKTHQNYEEIHQFCQVVSGYADFLEEAHEKFKRLLELFNKRNEVWDENAKQQYAEIARQKKILEQDAEAIGTREIKITEAKKEIIREREHLASQQSSLLTAFKVEKDLWNKLQKK